MDIQLKKIFLTIFLGISVMSYACAQCTTTNNVGINSSASTSSFGQSFSPTCTGVLNTIAVNGNVSTSGHTVTVYDGLGTGGTSLGSLSSQSITATGSSTDLTTTVFDFSSENISLTSGADYTFVISGALNIRFVNSDAYADGQLFFNGSFAPGFDLNFEVDVTAPLPVVWSVQPQVEKVGSSARISFAIAQQINNSHFEVEHSKDKNLYQSIGQIAGEGNVSEEKTYTFYHESPNDGPNYYRVKQVDFDGNFSFSHVTTVSFQANQASVYPNPVTDMLKVNVPEIDLVAVYNLLGQQLTSHSLQGGTNMLDLSALQKGTYTLKFGNGEVKRIIKQ